MSIYTVKTKRRWALRAMALASIARSKLSVSADNLHRWVLLRNSLLASEAAPFMFPGPDAPNTRSSEALWLDSLLESLAHDEDDEYEPPIDDDDDDDPDEDDDADLSPMSSSDDLSQPFVRYYPRPTPIALPFPFAELDDSIEDDPDDPLKCSSCSSSSSTSSTSPSSSASSLPPATPPPSPLRSWASVPKLPLPPTSSSSPPPTTPALYIDAYSDPLPFSHTFTYDIQSPFVFHHC